MNPNLLRRSRATKRNGLLALLGFSLAVANAGHAAVSVPTLHSFGEGGPGFADLFLASDGNFYGTTFSGGTATNGTVFQYVLGSTVNTIYTFTGGADGALPEGNLAQPSDGNLYGTTRYGGTNSAGTAYRITTSGTLTTIYTFTGGGDGGTPRSGLLLGQDGNLYGTTINGGGHTNGTAFKITTNGVLTSLYSFTGGADGANPHTALIQGKDGGFYGTTFSGGTGSAGTIFRITSGGVFSKLYSFTGGADGGNPDANLIQGADGFLYGTTPSGGDSGNGNIFRISTNGGSFTNLYSFQGQPNDGASPLAGLVQPTNGNPSGTLYGTCYYSGANGDGTVFQVGTNGSYTNLYSFTGGTDGSEPFSDLVQAPDGNLYGTAFIGGGTDSGAIYSVNLQGTVTPQFSFPGTGDGANPDCNLIQGLDGFLYGTTVNGGANNAGTIFQMDTNGALTALNSFAGNIAGAPMAGMVQASDGTFYGTTSAGAGAIFKFATNASASIAYLFSGNFDGGGPNAVTLGADGNLYGTAFGGGADSVGTVFQYPLPSGSGTLNVLHTFTGTNDGGNPVAGLFQASDGNFYGSTSDFNLTSYGTIFRIATDGTFKTLYTFTNGLDGNSPLAPLMQASDGNLYGAASDFGTGDTGTLFRLTTNGAFTEIYSFGGTHDGSEPYAGLVQAKDGNLYGSTWGGGDFTAGALFSISIKGAFTPLYSFTGGDDGSNPGSAMVQGSDGNLYGTTYYGGLVGEGAIYKVVLSQTSGGPVAVTILSPMVSGGHLTFNFQTLSGQSYTIQQKQNLSSTNWSFFSNFTGSGSSFQFSAPITNGINEFFRVREP